MSTKVRFFQPKPQETNLSLFESLEEPSGGPMTAKAKVVPIEDSPQFAPVPTEPIAIDDLYREPLAVTSVLGPALRLLADAIETLQQSLVALRRGALIDSDDCLQRFQAMLPELFCCRGIGDGFGAIINALRSSFQNAAGAPFTEKQIEEIRKAVHQLRTQPYLRFEAAVEVITRLEDAGLTVEPLELATLTDLLDVEGLH